MRDRARGCAVGALAGAAYGLGGIPPRWRPAVHGTWPLGSGRRWREAELIELVDGLMAREGQG